MLCAKRVPRLGTQENSLSHGSVVHAVRVVLLASHLHDRALRHDELPPATVALLEPPVLHEARLLPPSLQHLGRESPADHHTLQDALHLDLAMQGDSFNNPWGPEHEPLGTKGPQLGD